ncbi:uncharacterized protein N7496_010252 [Penicillium cataractarum]|uniref:Uncharacterized protein n=1 Tax=Penicillium cataractarum TaxID=2100454 RepID=A0A9W9V1S2_9EURO|nr:uncharacterized protein N7496_010252 [Penicillium cataractarum]KAJ5364539.1 hypothetical protein N7496_010252 [Penicillium cataractarum]
MSLFARLQEWSRSMEAVGLNRIFGHREDELIHHDPTIQQQLPRATKPDAIYGLRQTRNIENLLNDTSCIGRPENGQDMLVYESLGEPPLSEEGDPVVFPFLLLEAKSAKSADSDWNSVQLQSAFPVRTLLRTQELLNNMTEPHAKQQADPLVWLLMNRGEDWRVSAAYVYNGAAEKPGTVGTTEYQIFDLWGGSVTSKNGALQLLLIVDYVFEWARDIYREDILNKLRIVASGQNDCASMIHPDTDIFSTLTSIHPSMSDGDSRNTQGSYHQGLKDFEALDSQQGIVRHATFVESQYRCFFVTRDNVTTMLQSTKDQSRKTLIRQIITTLQQVPLSISWACLSMIEEEWTGRSRMLRSHHLDQTKFYASVTYASFILPNWTQVRELTVIAVAEDAFEHLVTASMYIRRISSQLPLVGNECEMEALKNVIAKLHAGNTRHTLFAAIRRICLRIDGRGSQIRLVDSNAIPRDIVHHIYNHFKKGDLEPQEPCLHTSSSFDQIHLSNSSLEPYDFGVLNVSSDGCVLVYAQGHRHDRQMSSVCVFLTDGSPDLPTPEILGMAIKNTFENHDVYHTSRIHRVPNFHEFGKDKAGKRWNIKNSYGIFSEGFQFVDWISFLGCEPPVRQGSSLPGTSADLFSRNKYPWSEPGYISWNIAARIFIIYKIVTREVRYWRNIAKECKDRGIDCCDICAGEVEIGVKICNQCGDEIFDKVDEFWFENALLGKQPIDYRPINPELQEYAQNARFKMNSHEARDINVKFEKNLSFYEELDEEYNDLQELRAQTMKFDRIQGEAEWPSRKRRRSSEIPS